MAGQPGSVVPSLGTSHSMFGFCLWAIRPDQHMDTGFQVLSQMLVCRPGV